VATLDPPRARFCTWRTVLSGDFPALNFDQNRKYPLMAKLAARLLSMHATSCSSESLWSLMRWTYRDNRSRLGIEKAKMMVSCATHERLKRQQAIQDISLDAMDYMIDSIFG